MTARDYEARLRKLLEDAGSGSAAAVTNLIEEFGDALLRVFRRRRDSKIRSLYDSDDFLQEFQLYFLGHRIPADALKSTSSLRAYLLKAAESKTQDVNRRFHASKHDIQRETPLGSRVLTTRQVDPTLLAEALEQMEDDFSRLSEEERSIIKMRAGGVTYAEIARKTGKTARFARGTMRAFIAKTLHEVGMR